MNRVCLDLCGYYVFCNDVIIFSMTTDIFSIQCFETIDIKLGPGVEQDKGQVWST